MIRAYIRRLVREEVNAFLNAARARSAASKARWIDLEARLSEEDRRV